MGVASHIWSSSMPFKELEDVTVDKLVVDVNAAMKNGEA